MSQILPIFSFPKNAAVSIISSPPHSGRRRASSPEHSGVPTALRPADGWSVHPLQFLPSFKIPYGIIQPSGIFVKRLSQKIYSVIFRPNAPDQAEQTATAVAFKTAHSCSVLPLRPPACNGGLHSVSRGSGHPTVSVICSSWCPKFCRDVNFLFLLTFSIKCDRIIEIIHEMKETPFEKKVFVIRSVQFQTG